MRSAFYKDQILENSKRWSLQIIFLSLILSAGLLIYVTNQREFFVSESYITNEAPKRAFCEVVMSQLIKKNLSPKLMDEGLFDLVTRDKYEALYLSGKEKMIGVWSTEGSCKILIHGEELRSFDFFLKDSGKYPFYYIVSKITEHEFIDKEEN